MEIANIRLLKEPDKSFIVYRETNPFSTWHNHPEFELVLIKKGKGRRIIGDHFDRFEENDLVFVGPYTPHEWHCDPEYFKNNEFDGVGLVIQFTYGFLGEEFFEVPENAILKSFLINASRGYSFFGETKQSIISDMNRIIHMNDTNRLYTLLNIFRIFSNTKEYDVLSSPASINNFGPDQDDPMQKVLKYILQNFQKNIKVDNLLEVARMSNTAFYSSFKQAFRMSFKDYLLQIRIGYACKLLKEGKMHISEIGYDCGFENISNFNRQFKRIKRITPSQYQDIVNKE